jgi:hypothetical protein
MSDPVEVLIDRLRGTAQSLDAVADDMGLQWMEGGIMAQIDEQIFNCSDCNWWCDIDEEVSEYVVDCADLVCEQCATENYDWDGERG